ncbi:hypothetical protein ABL78_3008 [Leptomonas seymouri]|uniref:SET domain-containing protein n=1 Tax=Leptomonas seymouri TaxID=5684 RepID=A0A0N1PEZ6_LEPSE|nr:hypothetical protein ABL78_3008 [Leptomonas seymouri]|eukprot:KPI87898.1 hypothetical protein ABL78_3008 [Leptomonas seymouri]
MNRSEQLRAPPQDGRVRLTYASAEEGGRYAVAQRELSPGELVLAAAPYGLVMNPKFCPSALYLSARCASSSGAAIGSYAAEAPNNAKAGRASIRKNSSKHAAKSAATADAGAPFAALHKDALYGEGSQSRNSGDAVTATPSLRWYTTQNAFCAACFQEIPAGRWLCNRGSLAELAVDMSGEQEELDRQLRLAEAQGASKETEADDTEAAVDDGADGEGDDESGAHIAAEALRRLKKPTKSSKARKDGVVELKQKLLAKACAQREEIFYRRHVQRQSRAEHGCPAVRLEGWEACKEGDDDRESLTSLFTGAMSGCSGCGVLCYCSESCWRAHHTQHVESGECAVLRGIYPRLMSEYYSTGAGLSAVTAQGAVLLPGDEPLHWTRSSSEQKMLEFQSLLFTAVVLARVCRSGYQGHCKNGDSVVGVAGGPAAVATTAKEAAEPPPAVSSDPPAAVAQQPAGSGDAAAGGIAAAGASQSASPSPCPPNAVDSVVVPMEVLAIRETRSKAGLTGTVEVLDSDAELRVLATEGDAHAMRTESVLLVDALEMGSEDEASGALRGGDSATPISQQYVRLPRYADMAQMETNLSVISKTRRSSYQRYYRAFTKRVLPTLQLLNLSCYENNKGRATAATTDPTSRLCVSESYFLRLCAAAQCNSFGVYDTDDNCIAFGMYPEASYFNHSCVPNICRVMRHGGRVAAFYALRHISVDEPLTISYCDVEQQNSAERRRNLLETYRFFCMCVRCSGHAEGPATAVTRPAGPSTTSTSNNASSGALKTRTYPVFAVPPSLFEKPLLLCGKCAIRGYLRPIPATQHVDPASGAATWSMADVPVRVCTMCHCRVVRETVEAA